MLTDHIEFVFGLTFDKGRVLCLLNLHIQTFGLFAGIQNLILNRGHIPVQTPNTPDCTVEKQAADEQAKTDEKDFKGSVQEASESEPKMIDIFHFSISADLTGAGKSSWTEVRRVVSQAETLRVFIPRFLKFNLQ